MVQKTAFALPLVLAFALSACGAAPVGHEPTARTTEAITTTADLTGAWRLSKEEGTKLQQGFVLSSDGTYVRDQQRILNLMLVGGAHPGAGFVHSSGTYTFDAPSGTLTFHQVLPSAETLVFQATYVPGRVLNGYPIEGAPVPGPTLTLAPVGAAGEALKFDRVDSWCIQAVECAAQDLVTPACVGAFTCGTDHACDFQCATDDGAAR